MTLTSNDGRSYVMRTGGSISSYQSALGGARFDANGQVKRLQTRDLYINRNGLGEHRTLGRLADGGTVVSLGPNHGYVEHSLLDNGNHLVIRTELINGRSSSTVYRAIPYGKSQLLVFQPTVTYSPTFYSWLQVSWAAPVRYTWPGPTDPAAYADYYSPATTYTSPGAWMADYVLTSDLNEGYANTPTLSSSQSGATDGDDDLPMLAATVDAPITTAVRQQVVAQIGRELRVEEQAASVRPPPVLPHGAAPPQILEPSQLGAPLRGPALPTRDVPAVLDPSIQVFLVHTTLQVVAGAHQCQLSQGDVLLHPQPIADGGGTAELTVQSSRKGDCLASLAVQVPVRDLQEMSNHFKESIAVCVQTASDQQGTRLPAAPDAKPQQMLAVARNDPQRDATALAQIEQLRSHATEEEKALQQEIAPGEGVRK